MRNLIATALPIAALCVAALPIVLGACSSTPAEAPESVEQTQTTRVGEYDSRAVALAYYRSGTFDARMRALHAQHDSAKTAGDTARASALEERAVALQDLAHRQGFSTWPVDDVLALVADDVDVVAQDAGVDELVSRWSDQHRVSEGETVDVTDALVALFDPDPATLQVIADIRDQEPVPLAELRTHD
jgi:hypothetical protein